MSYNVDLQNIADELDFELEDIEMIFEVFLEGATNSLSELEEAIEKRDMEKIFHLSHSIKGSAANLMLRDISNIAKDMELSARAEEDIDYKSKFISLENLISKLTN